MYKNLKSTKKSDKKDSEKMEFLFDTIYSAAGIKTNRIFDKDMQIKEVDIQFLIKNKIINIEEKCAIKYWYKDLSTFCLELWKNEFYPKGWFHDDAETLTDCYAFAYVRADSKDLVTTNPSHFEVIIVKKNRLKKFLKTLGLKNSNEIIKEFNDLKKTKSLKQGKTGYYYYPIKDIKVMQCANYKEAAINIIIPKKYLIELASFYAELHNGKIKIIKNLINT